MRVRRPLSLSYLQTDDSTDTAEGTREEKHEKHKEHAYAVIAQDTRMLLRRQRFAHDKILKFMDQAGTLDPQEGNDRNQDLFKFQIPAKIPTVSVSVFSCHHRISSVLQQERI